MQDRVRQAFVTAFGSAPAVLTRAPGRLEILGNHTDYNQGLVLSVAVDRATYVALSPLPGSACRVIDMVHADERRFNLGDPAAGGAADWANYLKGVVLEFRRLGVSLPAFQAVLGSTVPLSAGMSSSAALEMSLALALAEVAAAEVSWLDLARIGQGCENRHIGARTGLLDQFSCLRGRAGHLVYSDFRTLTVEQVGIPPGTALVVANSMVRHTLTNEYNERREDCERAVELLARELPGVAALRDVTLAQLQAARDHLPPRVYRRAVHVVGENERVLQGVSALQQGDLQRFGMCMFASHESSRTHFENSCEELDTLVEIGRALPGAVGARLSGGGFGGISVHLVQEPQATAYADRLAADYSRSRGVSADVMICRAADGAGICAGSTPPHA